MMQPKLELSEGAATPLVVSIASELFRIRFCSVARWDQRGSFLVPSLCIGAALAYRCVLVDATGPLLPRAGCPSFHESTPKSKGGGMLPWGPSCASSLSPPNDQFP